MVRTRSGDSVVSVVVWTSGMTSPVSTFFAVRQVLSRVPAESKTTAIRAGVISVIPTSLYPVHHLMIDADMTLEETAEGIRTMEIGGPGGSPGPRSRRSMTMRRSSPSSTLDEFRDAMQRAADLLVATRPTAVSLPNAVRAAMRTLEADLPLDEARAAFHERAQAFIASSLGAVDRIGEFGARQIRDGDVVMTHCNSEAALACIVAAHRQGKAIEVFATESGRGARGC